MAKITINGQSVEIEDNKTVMNAAEKLGLDIPRYCYHPDLPIAGNCRMCLVEVEGMPKLTIACNTPVKDGMVVQTESPRVKQAVKDVLEFILINHPIDCPICDQAGECMLQEYYFRETRHDSRRPLEDKVHKKKVLDLGPMVVLDKERCILCSRCIRFTEDISGHAELQFFRRGDHVEIGTFLDRPMKDPYAGNVVDICPVGALTSKDFRFQSRVWFLRSADSVCAGCSTGCNIRIDYRDRIYRLIPRRNPDVNASWICDQGRMSFKSLHESERLKVPLVNRMGEAWAAISWKDVIHKIARGVEVMLKDNDAKCVAGIGSAMATNESLFLFKKYLTETVGASLIDFRIDDSHLKVEKREDQILKRADKHPNARGAQALGLESPEWKGLAHLLDRVKRKEIRIVFVIDIPQTIGDIDSSTKELLGEILAYAEMSVVLTSDRQPYHKGADVLLPIAKWSEEDGCYTNYQGRVQLAQRALPAPGEARPAWEVFADLIRQAGGDSAYDKVDDVLVELAGVRPEFQGLSHKAFRLMKRDIPTQKFLYRP